MNFYDGNAREIKYNEEWNNGASVQNQLEKANEQLPVSPDAFYNEVPAPLLKAALDKFGKGNKEKQQNIVQAIWTLLFGEATTTTAAPSVTTTTTTKATTAAPSNSSSTTPSSSSAAFEKELEDAAKYDSSKMTRTRRPTKFQNKGYCKNPPKAHSDAEDKLDGEDDDEIVE